MKFTKEDLLRLNNLTLADKIQKTQARIIEWYQYFDGNVYVSFSGGKDSTVLLNEVRKIYPDVPAVFVDTGLEYPEVRAFVETKDNVVWLRPSKNFKQVIEEYGFPVVSKEVSKSVSLARGGNVRASQKLRGELYDADGKKSPYNQRKHGYLLDAPFKISDKCCYHLKKSPVHKYERQTKRAGILGMMAEESLLRTNSFYKSGCNAFDGARPISNPLSFWTEQDILQYLKQTEIPYASIYGDIVECSPERERERDYA